MHKVESLTKEQMAVLKGLDLFTSLVGLPDVFEYKHIPLLKKAREEYAAKEKAWTSYQELYRESLRYSTLERPYSNSRKVLTDLLILQGKHTQHSNTYEAMKNKLVKLGVQEHFLRR